MNISEYTETIINAFNQNGLAALINEEKAKKLYDFSNLLVETNKTFNLTAITDEKEIILKHFVDCAAILKYIPQGSTLVDVGCGAGFPSLPIAILRDDVRVTALDSTAKKINFINSTAEKLSIGNTIQMTRYAVDSIFSTAKGLDSKAHPLK